MTTDQNQTTHQPLRFVRAAGVQVRRYLIVDMNGQTRSLTDHQLSSRRMLLSLHGGNKDWLIRHYPRMVDGKPTGDWDDVAVADAIKRQALFKTYHLSQAAHVRLRQKGLRA
ncbi:hypothetical protein [Acetobacter sp.]|uniref:hypothetical protein n=1 Tax=Acetobacter sp. TaxID=440 RepID=UPI00258C6B9F|nr:hypothetical protein [Acetobacter sp.]MCC6104791.1 hypothetical protein [Acetobacter sp.]